VSITDGCLGWSTTETLLQGAARLLGERQAEPCETRPVEVR